MYTIPRRVNGQGHMNVLCISRRQSETGKKKLSRAWNFILVCVTRTNKIYQGQKENTETAENQFCRLFIFHSLVSILAKRGSDNDPNRDRIHSPAWEERCYKILFDTIACLMGPGRSSFLKHEVPYVECGIDYD